MQNLLEYLYNEQYNSILIEKYCEVISEEVINEAFQSSLLLALAKEIDKAEAETKVNDKKRAEQYSKDGYIPTKDAKSFATIFGPVVIKTRRGEKTGVVAQGLKWSEIKDEDFKKYTDVNDKEFKKLIKSVYDHKSSADFICCEPGTKNVIYFIKGYNVNDKEDIKFYQFISNKAWYRKGVQEKTAPKGKYNERSLKMVEVLPLITGLDIYVLPITDSMKKDYNLMFGKRLESQKGVVNYDKASLESLLKEQQARYKAIVEKMKALKLQSNSEKFLDDIIATNKEVSDLYKKIISNPANMDMGIDLGDLIQYVSYAYEQYYKSMQYTRSADKAEESNPNHSFTKYDRESAQNYINTSKTYLDKTKKKIEEIKAKIK